MKSKSELIKAYAKKHNTLCVDVKLTKVSRKKLRGGLDEILHKNI